MEFDFELSGKEIVDIVVEAGEEFKITSVTVEETVFSEYNVIAVFEDGFLIVGSKSNMQEYDIPQTLKEDVFYKEVCILRSSHGDKYTQPFLNILKQKLKVA
ncbi:MAG: hypothetical protein WDZ40_00790 [Candidatus Spechtbacterales bacterium]